MALLDLYSLLLGFQSSQVKAVRAVDPINYRQHEQRRLPTGAAVDDSHQPHRGGSNQVVRERPEIAVRPNFTAGLVFRESNHHGNWQRIRQKENHCGGHEQDRFIAAHFRIQPVIAYVTESAGIGHHSEDVEQDLHGIQPVPRLPDALHQSGGAANEQSFRQTQFHHAKKNEKEIY